MEPETLTKTNTPPEWSHEQDTALAAPSPASERGRREREASAAAAYITNAVTAILRISTPDVAVQGIPFGYIPFRTAVIVDCECWSYLLSCNRLFPSMRESGG